MSELIYVYATAAVILAYFLARLAAGRFDPFEPTWLYLVGYVQIYIVQALSYHDWAVGVRGAELVASANGRALWALLWFFAVYHLAPGRAIVAVLPRPPRAWSTTWVAALSPPLILWGLYCAGVLARSGSDTPQSAEAVLLGSFAFMLLVAGVMLLVTGRMDGGTRPAFYAAGLAICLAYAVIWMFNGKRSHSLFAVLATMCALYVTRQKRPSWPVLFLTACAGVLVVGIAIGWRNDRDHDHSSFGGFIGFLADFRFESVLASMNVSDGDEELDTYETTEYGGFLLMMDTVPHKSDYDYGANYIKVFSTFIPRIIWPTKPIYGREKWIGAWQAGSELEREDTFASPAIGILGATQLNGGAVGTLIVVAAVALMLRSAYSFFQRYADNTWVQFWWSIFYFNAWFMVVCDDPMVWFYFNWGFTGCPVVILTWLLNWSGAGRAAPAGSDRSYPGVTLEAA